jgi:hypothetical protein
MPKFVIEREIPGAGNLSDYKRSRESPSQFLKEWVLRFNGCKAM